MVVAELDDVRRRRHQAGPPGVHLDLGPQQLLAPGRGRTADDVEDDASVLRVALQPGGSDPHLLALACHRALAQLLGFCHRASSSAVSSWYHPRSLVNEGLLGQPNGPNALPATHPDSVWISQPRSQGLLRHSQREALRELERLQGFVAYG